MERNLWRDAEIKALLDIIEKEKILNMINEKKFRNEQIFRFVESEMHTRGFTRKNYQQIWTKWKFLKSSYVTTTRHNSVPGNTPRTCDYYFLLDRILHDDCCPSVVASAATPGLDVNGGIEIKQEVVDEPEPESILPDPEIVSTPVLSPKAIIPEIMTNGHLKRKLNHTVPIVNNNSTNNHINNSMNKMPTPPSPKEEYPDQLSFEDLNGGLDDEPSSKRKPLQGSYFRAMKELANNLRQMQRDLIDEFFKKQEELMREEHEFQKQQDEVLLRSFEEQTRLLLDGARNLISSGVTEMPDIVYINED